MKDMMIKTDGGETELSLEDGNNHGPRAVLNMGYFDRSVRKQWQGCGCYLTLKRAEQLRDWLTGWLNEQKKMKVKR